MHEFNCYVAFTFTRDEDHDIVEPFAIGAFTDVRVAYDTARIFAENAKAEGKDVYVDVKATTLLTDKFMV